MIGDERDNLRVNAWIRGGKKNGFFVRPRLFMPYYEEIKVLLITFKFLGIYLSMVHADEFYLLAIIVLGGRTDGSRS